MSALLASRIDLRCLTKCGSKWICVLCFVVLSTPSMSRKRTLAVVFVVVVAQNTTQAGSRLAVQTSESFDGWPVPCKKW